MVWAWNESRVELTRSNGWQMGGHLAQQRGIGAAELSEIFLRKGKNLVGFLGTGVEEHHATRREALLKPAAAGRRVEAGEGVARAEDVVGEGSTGIDKLLEVIEYGLGRGVEIGVDFLPDHELLLRKLSFGEVCVGHHVADEGEGAREVAGGEGRVDHRLLLGRVGVEFAPDEFHAAADIGCAVAAGAFEDGVLDEMGESLQLLALVAAAGIDRDAAVFDR